MVKLRQDGNGKYLARKRLPDDVREEYGRRYKAHHEAKFSAPASDGPHIAKQKFREWDAEITARIEAIRAERKGDLSRHGRRAGPLPQVQVSWSGVRIDVFQGSIR